MQSCGVWFSNKLPYTDVVDLDCMSWIITI